MNPIAIILAGVGILLLVDVVKGSGTIGATSAQINNPKAATGANNGITTAQLAAQNQQNKISSGLLAAVNKLLNPPSSNTPKPSGSGGSPVSAGSGSGSGSSRSNNTNNDSVFLNADGSSPNDFSYSHENDDGTYTISANGNTTLPVSNSGEGIEIFPPQLDLGDGSGNDLASVLDTGSVQNVTLGSPDYVDPDIQEIENEYDTASPDYISGTNVGYNYNPDDYFGGGGGEYSGYESGESYA